MLTSPNDRLKSALQEMNYCCGWFARMPTDIKDAAYESLSAYNLLYEESLQLKYLSETGAAMLDGLFTTVKFMALPNSIQRKRDYLRDHWVPIRSKLEQIGIIWKDKPKPN